MKSSTIILVLILAVTATAGAIITIDDAYADDSAESYRIWGSSTADKGSLRLAITEDSKIIFPKVTWSIWLDDPTHVKLTTPSGVLVDEILSAGIHDYAVTYDTGAVTTTWTIGDDRVVYELTATSGAANALELDDPDIMMSIARQAFEENMRDIAVGCIICTLIPSIFIIPYFRRKKDDEYYIPF